MNCSNAILKNLMPHFSRYAMLIFLGSWVYLGLEPLVAGTGNLLGPMPWKGPHHGLDNLLLFGGAVKSGGL